MASLLMSTDDKSNGHITNDEESGIYNELENDVQEIALEYTKNFFDIDPSFESDDVRFKNAATLSTELCEAKDNYHLGKLERTLAKADLLILGELSYLSFNRTSRNRCLRSS